MSEQNSGLRFDIYERVRLPEHTASVKEISAIELSPEIRITQQGEQAVLKGHLALSGTYDGEDETSSVGADSSERSSREVQLSHRIPVEITLPMNRIGNVNDIQVEIENFDVDVLSPRTLNVTGVLSLRGIEMEAPAETAWREEEVVFSHRIEPEAAPDEPAVEQAAETQPEPLDNPPAAEENENAAVEEEAEAEAEAGAEEGAEAEANKLPWWEKDAAGWRDRRVEPAAEAGPAATETPAAEALAEEATAPEGQVEAEEPVSVEESANPEAAAQAEEAEQTPSSEKQEIKIAFSGKTLASDETPIGVNALMAMAGSTHADKRREPPPQQSEEAAEPAEGKDRLEWKKLFLQSSAEGPSFRKVRMCIAQKEDTIETIAERYQIELQRADAV